jgi:hypothetical protein
MEKWKEGKMEGFTFDILMLPTFHLYNIPL